MRKIKMKLLIENFRKFLKEQEGLDAYGEVIKLYTDDGALLDALRNNEGNEESAASEIIEDMKNWIEREDALGEGQWDEIEALKALSENGKEVKKGETLQSVIVALIGEAKFNDKNN